MNLQSYDVAMFFPSAANVNKTLRCVKTCISDVTRVHGPVCRMGVGVVTVLWAVGWMGGEGGWCSDCAVGWIGGE
jgi:hypothetical protein